MAKRGSMQITKSGSVQIAKSDSVQITKSGIKDKIFVPKLGNFKTERYQNSKHALNFYRF
jgi:hypothetical protein